MINTDYTYLIYYIVAYIIGSIPFGLIYAKKFANIDIKNIGSGSTGATNVLRALKDTNHKLAKKLAIATMASDILKIFLQLVFYRYILNLDDDILWAIGLFSVIGHIYSIFLKFKGGKGVSTAFGVVLFIRPIESIIALLIWFIIGRIFKISSIASLSASISFFIISYIISPELTLIPPAIMLFLIIYKHIPNIKRLILKKEEKIIEDKNRESKK